MLPPVATIQLTQSCIGEQINRRFKQVYRAVLGIYWQGKRVVLVAAIDVAMKAGVVNPALAGKPRLALFVEAYENHIMIGIALIHPPGRNTKGNQLR